VGLRRRRRRTHLRLAARRTSAALPIALLALLLPAAAFILGNETLVVLSYVVEGGRAFKDIVVELAPQLREPAPVRLARIPPRSALPVRRTDRDGADHRAILIAPRCRVVHAREGIATTRPSMLIHALERRTATPRVNSERVADYARYIGEELNFMPARSSDCGSAALMHYIGTRRPEPALNKPGRLTPRSRGRSGPLEVSVQMLTISTSCAPIAAASHSDQHPVRPDDPDHPIEPYIVRSRRYDAMTSTRAYRRPVAGRGLRELRDKAGIQFHRLVSSAHRGRWSAAARSTARIRARLGIRQRPVRGLGSAGLGDQLATRGTLVRPSGRP